jgi:acyl carrier protein
VLVLNEKLKLIFLDILDFKGVLEPHFSQSDIDGWDSTSNVVLLIAIESEFDIQFSPEEIETMSTVGEIASAVEARLASLK